MLPPRNFAANVSRANCCNAHDEQLTRLQLDTRLNALLKFPKNPPDANRYRVTSVEGVLRKEGKEKEREQSSKRVSQPLYVNLFPIYRGLVVCSSAPSLSLSLSLTISLGFCRCLSHTPSPKSVSLLTQGFFFFVCVFLLRRTKERFRPSGCLPLPSSPSSSSSLKPDSQTSKRAQREPLPYSLDSVAFSVDKKGNRNRR